MESICAEREQFTSDAVSDAITFGNSPRSEFVRDC